MFEMEQFAAAMQKVFECREIEMTGVAGCGKATLNLVTSDIVEAIRGGRGHLYPVARICCLLICPAPCSPSEGRADGGPYARHTCRPRVSRIPCGRAETSSR